MQTLGESAFDQLRSLLRGTEPPANVVPVKMHIGECQLAPILANGSEFELMNLRSYPPLGGTASLHSAYGHWLERRFNIELKKYKSILYWEPTPGAKQSVSVLIQNAIRRARKNGVAKPRVLVPNPGYPTYFAATEYGDGSVVLYENIHQILATPATKDIAAIVVCHPDNPTGRWLCKDEMKALCTWAAQVQPTIIVDECYIDLYFNRIPEGFITCLPNEMVKTLSFAILHSLSKRSSMPGLRQGFVVGDIQTVQGYARYNHACGVSTSSVLCEMAAKYWNDDQHVSVLRERLRKNMDIIKCRMNDIVSFSSPAAGLFVWMNVGDGEKCALNLWKKHGVMVMPGKYLARNFDSGRNPGATHIRISLGLETIEFSSGIDRIRESLRSLEIDEIDIG